MAAGERFVQMYEELADWHGRHSQPQKRDRFLLLAADAALAAGDSAEAERLRARLLEQNPHHLLRPYSSLTEALQSLDVRNYVSDLRQTHQPEDAERLWRSLHKEEALPAKTAGSSSPPNSAGDRPAMGPSGGVGDSLKVYRVKIEEEESVPPRKVADLPRRPSPLTPAAPSPPNSAARRATAGPRPAVSVPPSKPDTYSVVSAPSLPSEAKEAAVFDDDEPGDGAWVASGLFWLVLTVGVFIAGYVLLRPLWPQ